MTNVLLGRNTYKREESIKSGDISSGRSWAVGWYALLALLCLAAFLQVRSFDFLGYDDANYIGKSSTTALIGRGLTTEGFRWVWTADAMSLWEPLSYLSHMVDVQLFGNEAGDAAGHHLQNLLIHIVNAFLVFSLLFQVGGSALPRKSRRWKCAVAFFASAMFAVHPLRAETVCWISERKGLLCAMFVLASLWTYVRFAITGRLRWLVASAVLTGMGMMSKPAAVVVPVLMGLLDIWPLRRCGFEPADDSPFSLASALLRQVAEKWLVILMAVLMAAVTIYVQLNSNTEKLIGAKSLASRIAHAPATVAFYLQRTFLPRNLSFEYPYPSADSSLVYLAVSALLFVALTVAVIVWRKRWPSLFFGWGWFVICWLPVSGLVYVGSSFTTDRYTYLPHVGLFFGIVFWIASWGDPKDSAQLENQPAKQQANRSDAPGDLGEAVGASRMLAASIAGGFLLVVLAFLSYRQAATWQSDITLNQHAVVAQPKSPTGHLNLGVALEKKGRFADAIPHLQNSVAVDETYTGQYSLGRALSQVGRSQEAMVAYQSAVEINPEYAKAWHNLSLLEFESAETMQAVDPAIEHVMKALNLVKGNNVIYLNSLAAMLIRQERFDEATQVVTRALSLGASNPAVQQELQRKMRDLRAAKDAQSDSG